MEKCYEGIVVPTPIAEPCGNLYSSTDCVTIPEPLIYLDLPLGASQTQVNQNLILALQASYAIIQNLTERIEILEGT